MTKILSASLVIIGGALLLVAHWTETYVDEVGFLHEPFAQLGIGYLLIIAGVVTGLIAWRRNRRNPEPPI